MGLFNNPNHNLGFKYVLGEPIVLSMPEKIKFFIGSDNLSFSFQLGNDLLYFLLAELNQTVGQDGQHARIISYRIHQGIPSWIYRVVASDSLK